MCLSSLFRLFPKVDLYFCRGIVITILQPLAVLNLKAQKCSNRVSVQISQPYGLLHFAVRDDELEEKY